MKKILVYLLIIGLFLWLMGGCGITNTDKGEKTPVDYEVTTVEEMPVGVQNLIDEKKEKDFQMTYQDGDKLYLIRGYGKQTMGGYSIQVENLYRGEEAITVRTSLIGPSKGEQQSGEISYPCIVLCMEYIDMPVIFE